MQMLTFLPVVLLLYSLMNTLLHVPVHMCNIILLMKIIFSSKNIIAFDALTERAEITL